MDIFNVNEDKVEQVRKRLNRVRKLAKKIDEMTYIDNKVNGFENHLYQVSSSDFNGNIDEFEEHLKKSLRVWRKESQ